MSGFNGVMGSICLLLLALRVILYAWDWYACRPRNSRQLTRSARQRQFRDGWGQLAQYEHLMRDDRTWLGEHFKLSEAWRWVK